MGAVKFGSRKAAVRTLLRHPNCARHLLSSVSVAVLVLSSALAMTGPVLAADWTGEVSNDWFTTGNWSAGAVPTVSDNADLNTNNPNYTNIDGPNAVANNVTVGMSAHSQLAIVNAGRLDNYLGYIGYSPVGSSFVQVTGANPVWTNTQSLYVGWEGQGEMILSAGGRTPAPQAR